MDLPKPAELVISSDTGLSLQWEKFLNEDSYEVFFRVNGTWESLGVSSREVDLECEEKEVVSVYYSVVVNQSYTTFSPIRSFLCVSPGQLKATSSQNLNNISISWQSSTRSFSSCYLFSEINSTLYQTKNNPFSINYFSFSSKSGSYLLSCNYFNSLSNLTFSIPDINAPDLSSLSIIYPSECKTLIAFQVSLQSSNTFVYAVLEIRDVCSISTGFECIRVSSTDSNYNPDLLTSFQYLNMSGLENLTADFYPHLIGKYSLSVIGLQSGVLGYFWDNIWFDGNYEIKTHQNFNLTWNGKIITGYANEFVSAKFFAFVVPRYDENYTIFAEADDNVRVYVNGNLLIDMWAVCCGVESGGIYMEKEKYYYFKVEYRQIYSEAYLKLFWSSRSQSKEIIPEYQLWMPTRIKSPWVQTATLGKSRWDLCYFTIDKSVKAGYQYNMNFYSVDYNGNIIDNPSDIYSIFFSDFYQLASTYIGNGQSSVNYTLTTKGFYSISIKLYDEHIKGSPYTLEVLAGDMSPDTTYSDIENLTDITVGSYFNFTIYPFDSYNNSLDTLSGLSVKIYLTDQYLSSLPISAPSGWLSKYNKTLISYNYPIVSFKSYVAGVYQVDLFVSNIIVSGYPKLIEIGHGTFMAEHSAVYSESTSVIAGETFTAYVQGRDHFYNNLTNNFTLSSYSFTCDQGNVGSVKVFNGAVQCDIQLTKAGNNVLYLLLDSVSINMPNVNVEANQILSYSYSLLEVSQSSYKSGSLVLATIISKDTYGNNRYNPDDSYAITVETEDFDVVDNEDGTYTISFTPLKTGTYKISVFANSLHIKGSPISISVSNSNVRGIYSELVTKKLTAGSEYLNITSKDIGGNIVYNPVRSTFIGNQYYVASFIGPVNITRNATFLDYSNFIINCSALIKSGNYSVTLSLYEENGLIGFYYSDNNFSSLVGSRDFNNHEGAEPKKYSEKDSQINFDWSASNPTVDSTVLPDFFSAYWVGNIRVSFTETYTFTINTDCRVSLLISGRTLFDSITTQNSISTLSGSLQLNPSTFYGFSLRYQNCGSKGKLVLYWSSPSESYKVISSSMLFAQINSQSSPYSLLVVPSSTSASRSTISSDSGIYSASAGVPKIFKLTSSDKYGNKQIEDDSFFAIINDGNSLNFVGSSGEYELSITFNISASYLIRVFMKDKNGVVESVKKFNVKVVPGPADAFYTQIQYLDVPVAGVWEDFFINLYDSNSNSLDRGGDLVEVKICYMTFKNVTDNDSSGNSTDSSNNSTNSTNNSTDSQSNSTDSSNNSTNSTNNSTDSQSNSTDSSNNSTNSTNNSTDSQSNSTNTTKTVEVCEEIPSSQNVIQDLKNGTYKASFLTYISQTYYIEILVNLISALNESVSVSPAEVSPAHSLLVVPSSILLNETLVIRVSLKDKYSNEINTYKRVIVHSYMTENTNFKPIKLVMNPINESDYMSEYLLSIENIDKSGQCADPNATCLFNGTLNVASWVVEPGLVGYYYNNLELTGIPKLTKVDSTLDFTFGESIFGISNGKFGVIWEGIVFVDGSDTNLTLSGDGNAFCYFDGTERLNLAGKNETRLIDEIFYFVEFRYNNSDSYGSFKLVDQITGNALTGSSLGFCKDGVLISGMEGIVLVN